MSIDPHGPGAAGSGPARRRLLLVGALAAALVLAGVGYALSRGSGSRAASPAPSGSPSATGPATPAGTSPAATTATTLRWHSCGKAQCSTLSVPLDWSGKDPASGGRTISLALLRYPATGPASQRLGSLLVNPGGPGESGVDFVRDDVSIFPNAIRARYDIVGFDPRGTGASAPVHCLTGPQLDALNALAPAPSDAAQQAALVAGAREEASACAAKMGDELSHIATTDVARDMDAIRAALGEAKLTYLGYSYGTFLGATYAEMFPGRVRAMVLDGAIDPSIDGIGTVTQQAGGFETAFNAFSAWCAGNIGCAFGAHDSGVAELQRDYDTLRDRVAANPQTIGGRQVGAGAFDEAVLSTLYSKASGWPNLGITLEAAQQGSYKDVQLLADEFNERNADGSYSTLDEADTAVNCVDRPWPRTVAAYSALADTLSGPDPRFGAAIAWSALACAFWPVPPEGTPHQIHAAGAPTILVVGTTRDPATPFAEARALAAQLDKGVLLTHDGDGHTAYSATGSACVLADVDRYLLTLQTAPRAQGELCTS